MGYIDITPPHMSAVGSMRAYKSSFTKGIRYSTDDADGERETIKNMWLKNGMLRTAEPFCATDITFEGEGIHSFVKCFGYLLLHSGGSLYALGDGEEYCTRLLDNIPDKNSFFVEFFGKMYLYCHSHVYSVDRALNAKQEMPFCPVYSRHCYRGSGTVTLKESGFVPNILAPVCRVYYTEQGSGVSTLFRFPNIMDKTENFEVYVDDVMLNKSEYTYDSDGFNPVGVITARMSPVYLSAFM